MIIFSHLLPRELIVSALLTASYLLFCLDCVASDMVKREICITNGTVWVEDSLHISGDMAIQKPQLEELFIAVRDKETNLLAKIRGLIEGEDLEMKEHTAKYDNGNVDLRILSKLKISSSEKLARLRLISTFAGSNAGLKPAAGERGDGFVILETSGIYVLIFPNFERIDENLEELEKNGLSFDRVFAGDRQFECTMKLAEGTKQLLWWDQRKKNAASKFNSASLREIDKVQKMTGNDQLSLATSLKLAKGGYYYLGQSGK